MTSKELFDHLDTIRGEWSDAGYAFHFTDLSNLGNIAKSGYLYSRSLAEVKGLIARDGGSKEIIKRVPWTKNYVRMYLRPKTPMLYHVEGIKPYPSRDQLIHFGNRIPSPHIPIPVYIIYIFEKLFSENNIGNIIVSDGNISASYSTNSKNQQLNPFNFINKFIKWDDIFSHDKYKNQAEILIKDKVNLTSCTLLFRSNAEKYFATNMFPEISQYFLTVNSDFFNCFRCYLERIDIIMRWKRLELKLLNFTSDFSLRANFINLNNNRTYNMVKFQQYRQNQNIYILKFTPLPHGEYLFNLFMKNGEDEDILIYRDTFIY